MVISIEVSINKISWCILNIERAVLDYQGIIDLNIFLIIWSIFMSHIDARQMVQSVSSNQTILRVSKLAFQILKSTAISLVFASSYHLYLYVLIKCPNKVLDKIKLTFPWDRLVGTCAPCNYGSWVRVSILWKRIEICKHIYLFYFHTGLYRPVGSAINNNSLWILFCTNW